MSAEKTYTLELTQAEARALCAAYQGEGLASVATWDEWTTVHRLLHAAADLLRSELAKLDGQPSRTPKLAVGTYRGARLNFTAFGKVQPTWPARAGGMPGR